MAALEWVRLALVVIHILGLAVIIGTFAVQLRADRDFRMDLVLGGAITQVVTGLALVGVREVADLEVDNAKIAVKLLLGLVVLVAAIVGTVRQRRGGRAKPWFHSAGGLAVVNVLVAVLWT